MELLSYIRSFNDLRISSLTMSDMWTATAIDTTINTMENRSGRIYLGDTFVGGASSISYPANRINLDDSASTIYDRLSAGTISTGTFISSEPIRMGPSIDESFRQEILQSVSDAIRDACSQFIGRPNNETTTSSIANEVARILRSEMAATTEANNDGTTTISIPLPNAMDDIRMNINISSELDDST